nr:Ty1-copia retrotransposon protein [Tanacetum cinerariifolium]
MNDVDDRWNKMIESRNKIIQIFGEMILQREQAANLTTHTLEPSRHFNSICYDGDDDDEEKTIPLRDIISQLPLPIVINTSPLVLPIEDPEDSLIMRDGDLNTIPKKGLDEVIKSSVEDFVPIQSESEDTFRSDSECDLPSCDDFFPFNVLKGKSMIFSNPLFDLNDDFIFSDDESLSDEDILFGQSVLQVPNWLITSARISRLVVLTLGMQSVSGLHLGSSEIRFQGSDSKLLIFFEQLKIDYVLSQDAPENEATPEISIIPLIGSSQNETDEAKRKFDKDNTTAKGHLLNHMSNSLFDLFINQKFAEIIWETLEKNMVQMMQMCEILQANVLLEKFPPLWNDYRNQLKHKKRDLSLQELISRMRTKEANHLKDKQISNSSSSVKANLVESASTSKNNRNKSKDKYCKDRKDQQIPNQRLVGPQANLVEDEIIAAMVVETNLVEDKSAWIMDSGALRHLCNNKRLFHHFEEVTD